MPDRNSFARRVTRLVLAAAWVAVLLDVPVLAGEPSRTPDEWLKFFGDHWSEDGWNQPTSRRPYLRALDDKGWQVRMLTMRGLVWHGKDAVEPLIAAMQDGDVATRILAAQTLGHLAPHVPRDKLLAAARSDAHPAVRLFAADSLGMQGGKDASAALAALQKSEKNRDVRKHLAYAQERKAAGVDPSIVRSLRAWDPKTMNTAKVGKPAPDFTLKTVSGKSIRLSQFRGKQAVVLVFIYGDT